MKRISIALLALTTFLFGSFSQAQAEDAATPQVQTIEIDSLQLEAIQSFLRQPDQSQKIDQLIDVLNQLKGDTLTSPLVLDVFTKAGVFLEGFQEGTESVLGVKIPGKNGLETGVSRGPSGPIFSGASGREDGMGEALPSVTPLSVGTLDGATAGMKPSSNSSRIKHSSLHGKGAKLPRPGEKVSSARGEGMKSSEAKETKETKEPKAADGTRHSGGEQGESSGSGQARPAPLYIGQKAGSQPAIPLHLTPNPEAVEKSSIVMTPAAKKRIEQAIENGTLVPAAPGGNPPAQEGTPNPEGEYEVERIYIDPNAAVRAEIDERAKVNPPQ